MDEQAQIQRKIGVMYQSGALFGSLNVLENVRFPLDQFTDLAKRVGRRPRRRCSSALSRRAARSSLGDPDFGGHL